jgi:predicted MFS family arabinose efflux permease
MKEHIGTNQPLIKPSWNAIFSLALGVAGLITSEFLPVSLLTPMAQDLGITEGVAGQAISITAVVAMVSSLLIAIITKRIDRRWVLLSFSVLQISSNLIVAFAPNFTILATGRILLGIAIGGFWSMCASSAMRLVPEKSVPKAISIVFGAVSVATVVSAPLGSFLGDLWGWRNVFLIAASLGVLSFVWQIATLPSMKNEKAASFKTLLLILERPKIKIGMLATMFAFMGYATFFTYLRPFLETVTVVNVNMLSTILLVFGIANLIGTTMAGFFLQRNLKRTLTLLPLAMGVIVGLLLLFGKLPVAATILIVLWGLTFGGVQVGWTTWLTKTIPDEAESGGGIQIAAIQLAITTGAGIGGLFFDFTGVIGVFICSSIITILAAYVAFIAFKINKHSVVISKNEEKINQEKLVA